MSAGKLRAVRTERLFLTRRETWFAAQRELFAERKSETQKEENSKCARRSLGAFLWLQWRSLPELEVRRATSAQ